MGEREKTGSNWGKLVLNSINLCVTGALNIEVKVVEQVYNAPIESRMMTGVEIWGLEDGWKEIVKVHELFCKSEMGMPNMAANGACVRVGKIKWAGESDGESLDIGKDCGKWMKRAY
jgi:hypothetical protein